MKKIIWLKLRLVMGLIFLWAFVDKLFGLGFATKSENSWLNGGSPTSGYLMNAVHGPFAGYFKSLAGVAIVDWLFMAGLLAVGLTLVINRYVMWGAVAGSIMLLLMWISAFPPENNPLLDDHIVYALVLVLLAYKSKENR
ncbi:MAG: hypothetical protein WAX80_03660 [Minisyncoccia bacterium]